MSLSVGKVSITVFWDCEGVILVFAMLKEGTFISNTTSESWQNSESILDEFRLTRIQQESCFRQWKAAHKFQDFRSHHIHPTSPIKRPQISTCLESWRILSMTWSLRLMTVWLTLRELPNVSKTGHGTDKGWTYLFFSGVRLWKWMGTLWKNKEWIKYHQS